MASLHAADGMNFQFKASDFEPQSPPLYHKGEKTVCHAALLLLVPESRVGALASPMIADWLSRLSAGRGLATTPTLSKTLVFERQSQCAYVLNFALYVSAALNNDSPVARSDANAFNEDNAVLYFDRSRRLLLQKVQSHLIEFDLRL
jgi:hypothetical protein